MGDKIEDIFWSFWIIVLMGINFKVYKDKNASERLKNLSFMAIVSGIVFIIMIALFNIF